jgi:hypothetical protein
LRLDVREFWWQVQQEFEQIGTEKLVLSAAMVNRFRGAMVRISSARCALFSRKVSFTTKPSDVRRLR